MKNVSVILNNEKLIEFAGDASSTTELAARIGVSYVTLWRIQTGVVGSPSLGVVGKILRAFPEATFEDLFEVRELEVHDEIRRGLLA